MRRRDFFQGSALLALGALAPQLTRAAPTSDLPATWPEPPPLVPPERGARLLEQAWRFHLGDVPMPKLRGHRVSYDATKAGGAIGAAAAIYDDAEWRQLDLPHDWAIERPPSNYENLAQGYRERGYGWYRRSFHLEENLRGRYLELQFGAIATNATIWFNGIEVAHSWSGSSAIYIDLTAGALFGGALNTIAIRVDAERIEGWWYEGAGPYRHVWLIDRAPVHIVTDGVHADPRLGSDGRWRVPVVATLHSIEEKPAELQVMAELLDGAGRALASQTATVTVAPLGRTPAKLEIGGIAPLLWSVDEPNLYTVRTRVLRDGRTLDERVTPCGFRTLRFDPEQGFFLNGKHLKIKGVCIHQDHAGVGVAVPDALAWWRVQRLKEMGCNAIRFSHNATDTALLDACDRLGLLVMDENRLFNVSPDYLEQLEWLVRRDRNRPSVFLWSVFNEEPMQATQGGYEMVRRAAAAVKALDDSRLVTAAMSGGMFTPVNVSQAVDVVGFNYQQASYDQFHREHPTLPLISSEDTSAFMVRGEWKTDEAAHIKAEDDAQHALWGGSHRRAWKEIATRPFVAGAFVWTGYDYHGEPTPYDWPSTSSQFGVLDLCGFAKSAFHIRRAQWLDEPVLQILPHWNRSAGETIKVLIATNLDRVELLLNGASVSDGPVDRYEMIAFDVPFAPGRLEARGWRGGKLVATHAVETTGLPTRLRLTPARTRLRGDGADALPVTIEALDARGRRVPTADLRVDLTVAGGRLIGVGNGNPNSLASGKESHVDLFNGLAQAILQSERGGHDRLTLAAASSGLAPARTALHVIAASLPSVAPGPLRFMVQGWRQSAVVAQPPGRPEALADNDMNSWQAVSAGVPPPFSGKNGYVTVATTVIVPAGVTERGGALILDTVNGKGTLWLNGVQAAEKTTAEGSRMQARIVPGQRQLAIALVLEALPAQRTGLPGLVFIETEQR